MYGEKHLARVQARIHAAGDHLVQITLASGAPWRRALEREGRASKYTPGPRCGKWTPLAALADPGGDPSRVHGLRGIWLQRPRPAVACCDVTQTRMGVQGRFWDASARHSSQSTLPPGVQRCAVWLPVRAAKRFQHSNPSFCFVLPSPILDGLPAPNAI